MDTQPIFDSFIQQFLRFTFIDTSYMYVNLWSLVHFSSGLILGLLLVKFYKHQHAWLIALAVLTAYEIIEIFLVGILFVGETTVDVVWDLIIGMTGFIIAYNIIKPKIKNN